MQSTDIPPGVKKEAAKQEPAWGKCDNIELGLKIWRVVKFKVSNQQTLSWVGRRCAKHHGVWGTYSQIVEWVSSLPIPRLWSGTPRYLFPDCGVGLLIIYSQIVEWDSSLPIPRLWSGTPHYLFPDCGVGLLITYSQIVEWDSSLLIPRLWHGVGLLITYSQIVELDSSLPIPRLWSGTPHYLFPDCGVGLLITYYQIVEWDSSLPIPRLWSGTPMIMVHSTVVTVTSSYTRGKKMTKLSTIFISGSVSWPFPQLISLQSYYHSTSNSRTSLFRYRSRMIHHLYPLTLRLPGKHSTQDEYGTAAYKTVELDTYLDDKPIQHRSPHKTNLTKLPHKTNLKNLTSQNYPQKTNITKLPQKLPHKTNLAKLTSQN